MRALLVAPLLLVGTQDAAPYAQATLNVRQADGYRLVQAYDVPAEHRIHDNLIAFEGPGWESDRVAYRLYLDERNVPDVYGKRLPGPILPKIGMGGDDYHAMADWGMDIFHVDQSLGVGGIGVLREGRATQLGPAKIHVTAMQWLGRAVVGVRNEGFPGAGGRSAELRAGYLIGPGSRITWVKAGVLGAAPTMIAGLTKHAGVDVVRSPAAGDWRYLASYGVQSLANDRLGIVLFYRLSDVAGEGDDGRSLFIRFRDPAAIRYGFAAAWEQEPDAPKDLPGFRAWLEQVDAALERGDDDADQPNW